ncbi:MAG: hypothetical protein AB8U25_07275 [Rickettsiales endosymbiont of Dermacentor nuttalli]
MSITEGDIGDLCLRTNTNATVCNGHEINGLIIDFYDNPNLNAPQLIASDLYKLHDKL